jgi:predicted TIM-barrel fold metal-dependent hydrolase
MWGTDAPSTLANYSLEHLLGYQWACFSDDEREKVFSGNAKTWYFE